MMPPQPNTIDPRAEIEAIFAHEQLLADEPAERLPQNSERKKHFTPHIARDNGITELELIEQAKAHAPAREKSNYEQLQQIALISAYVNHLRDNNTSSQQVSSGLLQKASRLLTSSNGKLSTNPTRRELIQRESEIGGHLFGAVPHGHHRQFFNLDPVTWIWYEEWKNRYNKAESKTTRYEVHENGILKVQEGARYYFIEGHELDNLLKATRMYYERVAHDIYNFDAATGKSLSA